MTYLWASLVAQMVKNLPAVWMTWVPSLGQEDPLEEGLATPFSILVWRIPMDRGAWRATAHGVTKSRTRLSNFQSPTAVLLKAFLLQFFLPSISCSTLKGQFYCLLTIKRQTKRKTKQNKIKHNLRREHIRSRHGRDVRIIRLGI